MADLDPGIDARLREAVRAETEAGLLSLHWLAVFQSAPAAC